MDNKKDLKTISKGWTVKNIGIGLWCVGAGFFFILLAILVGFSGIDSGKLPPPLYVNIIDIIALILMAIGALGFWFVIPAFQKWKHTKYEWGAWLFLAIATLLICVLIYFRNVLL